MLNDDVIDMLCFRYVDRSQKEENADNNRSNESIRLLSGWNVVDEVSLMESVQTNTQTSNNNEVFWGYIYIIHLGMYNIYLRVGVCLDALHIFGPFPIFILLSREETLIQLSLPSLCGVRCERPWEMPLQHTQTHTHTHRHTHTHTHTQRKPYWVQEQQSWVNPFCDTHQWAPNL